MLKIVLVRPPTFLFELAYPLNIEYIASSLKSDKHDTIFVDAEYFATKLFRKLFKPNPIQKIYYGLDHKKRESRYKQSVEALFEGQTSTDYWDSIARRILSHKPDIVAFSCYSVSMTGTILIARKLKRIAKNIPIILGGIHPTLAPEETMKKIPEIDYLVIGEGELTIKELVASLESGVPEISQVKGIAYRNNGKILQTESRQLMQSLDELPILTFDYADKYFSYYLLLTSRGCPYNCHFCASKNMFGRKVRYRSAEHIVQEIINLKTKRDVKFLRFGDDTFTLRNSHISDISNALKKEKIRDIAFAVGARIDTIDKQKIGLLKSLNVKNVSIGVESGSQRVGDSICKGINVKDVVTKVKMINDAGIFSRTFFIVNHPGETKDDMLATIDLMKKLKHVCKKNIINTNTGFPYPQTPWWTYCEKNNLISDIDFYNKSIECSQGYLPVVNMTSEPLDVLLKMRSEMLRIEWRNNVSTQISRAMKIYSRDLSNLYMRVFR